MKRKAVWLVVGCAALTLVYLATRDALKPQFIGRGRIFVGLKLVPPTNAPAMSNWNWYVSHELTNWNRAAAKDWVWFGQPGDYGNMEIVGNHMTISNWLTDPERMKVLIRDSAASDDSIQFMGANGVRGTSLIEVYFRGTDKSAVWRVASNACVMLAAAYATNMPPELQTTNEVKRTVEHIATGFWTPTPLWRRMLDEVEGIFR